MNTLAAEENIIGHFNSLESSESGNVVSSTELRHIQAMVMSTLHCGVDLGRCARGSLGSAGHPLHNVAKWYFV